MSKPYVLPPALRKKLNTPKLKGQAAQSAMWGKVGYGGAKWRAAVDEWG
jgi:hypothetical protein